LIASDFCGLFDADWFSADMLFLDSASSAPLLGSSSAFFAASFFAAGLESPYNGCYISNSFIGGISYLSVRSV